MASALLEWFDTNGRRYPFRETSDPYRILVSEMLLRQTTSRQVSAVYHPFFDSYSTINTLAHADGSEVLKIIKPLGIHNRAEGLVMMARQVLYSHQGEVPGTMDGLMALRGVGRYVASCVLSFGYGRWYPMVDSNIQRVLSRAIHGGDRPPSPKWAWSEYEIIGRDHSSRTLHSAIIDLSHIHCRPKRPLCNGCPLALACAHDRTQ
jgi:A/G-specific adenine glycosylase